MHSDARGSKPHEGGPNWRGPADDADLPAPRKGGSARAQMYPDLKDSDLSTVLAEGRRLADEATRAFGQLSPRQINWKPSAGEWSVGQCFDHLVLSNQGFLPIIEEVRRGRRPSAWERMPLLPGFFGRLLI